MKDTNKVELEVVIKDILEVETMEEVEILLENFTIQDNPQQEDVEEDT